MGRIHVLSETVANQIAAGEVVERPASVVKEMPENSLDAGATRIKISVEAGGKKLIQITDNGCGMVRDDAMLAFERHATSKIKNAEDLPSVATLSRSSAFLIFDVAWRSKASMASSRTIPQPLSVIWISFLPPASTLILMRVAPASSEFSGISLTTEAGRSTTSPAAIWLATVSESTWMRPMRSGQ